jgi:hypothetical protein
MKCDDCLNLLEAYLDGEANERESAQVQTHLATCANCATHFEALTAESEIYARYDRELQVSPSLWNAVAARINTEDRNASADPEFNLAEWFAGLFAAPSLRFAMPTVALIAIAVVVGLAYWRTRPQPVKPEIARVDNAVPPTPVRVEPPVIIPELIPAAPLNGNKGSEPVVAKKTNRPGMNESRAGEQSDVLFTDAAYTDMEDRDTASHLQQAQNLLLSIRNIKFSDDDEEVDVSYEKTESRRLLNENVVLRRDAEMAGKFPAKSVLGSLEPFLIDIANLPDKAAPKDVRQITDRVQKTEIVAELRGY